MKERNLYGLIGRNISYSFSVAYFSEKFKKNNDIKSQYVNFDIQNIAEFSNILQENPQLKGMNVTIPYKETIIPYLDSLSKKARKIGAVNTIRISKKGHLKGYNTDWFGFYQAIKPMLKSNHKKALILGTGGSSKAIEFALKKLNITYTFVSRTAQENTLQYREIDAAVMQNFQIIINTTPLGTFPNIAEAPTLPYALFSKEHIAFDLTYNPEISLFLKQAAAHGAKIQNGALMLKLQAEKAWKIWNKNGLISKFSED